MGCVVHLLHAVVITACRHNGAASSNTHTLILHSVTGMTCRVLVFERKFDKYASFATANVYKLLDSGPNKPNSKMETEIGVKNKIVELFQRALCYA